VLYLAKVHSHFEKAKELFNALVAIPLGLDASGSRLIALLDTRRWFHGGNSRCPVSCHTGLGLGKLRALSAESHPLPQTFPGDARHQAESARGLYALTNKATVIAM
jgi:hypothetical protein